jgi:hypothetical protein
VYIAFVCVFACVSKVLKYLEDITNEGSYIGVKVEFFITKSLYSHVPYNKFEPGVAWWSCKVSLGLENSYNLEHLVKLFCASILLETVDPTNYSVSVASSVHNNICAGLCLGTVGYTMWPLCAVSYTIWVCVTL